MNFIAHRINTIEELKKVPREYGVEIDLRDQGGKIILQHDPFSDGENFEEYLKFYQHGTLILNIKSERIEEGVLELIHKHNIKEYFFLDSSFPMIVAMSHQGEKNIAVRFSEYESIETVLNMKGFVDWVWVDCFTQLPVNSEVFQILKSAGFKLCLVSPELQNRPEEIDIYRKQLKKEEIIFDAICTKQGNIPQWQV